MAELNHDSLNINDSLTIQTENERAITLKGTNGADMAPLVWYDQFDRPIAKIGVEEYTLDGEWKHRLVVSTANAARDQLIVRFSIDFGSDDPVIGFAESRMRFDGDSSFLELKSSDGTYWRIGVDDDGVLAAETAPDTEDPTLPEHYDEFGLASDVDDLLLDHTDIVLLMSGYVAVYELLDDLDRSLFNDLDLSLVSVEVVDA